MVATFHFCVNFAGIWFPVVRAQDVVDSHIDAVSFVGEAGTIGRGCIAVGEMPCEHMMGIRDGSVVEIATEHNTHVGVGFQIF